MDREIAIVKRAGELANMSISDLRRWAYDYEFYSDTPCSERMAKASVFGNWTTGALIEFILMHEYNLS